MLQESESFSQSDLQFVMHVYNIILHFLPFSCELKRVC